MAVSAVQTDDLERWADGWLMVGDIQQHSRRTIDARREIVEHLLWFMRAKGHVMADVHCLRAFLHYCTHGHAEPGGRWGNPNCTRPVRPRTVHTYYGHLRTLFRWLVTEGVIDAAPTDRIPIPIARPDQIQPFSPEEVKRLLLAAKRDTVPRRAEAVVRMLYDTGLRASELLSLKVGDVELAERRVRVLGKGNKRRTVAYGARTARALWAYMREAEPGRAVFVGERGPLTRSGLQQIVERLGVAAGVDNVHPHRFRHSFAVEFLRSGGNVFTLQQILGHTALQMTQRYVAIAQADVEVQQRRHSPGDRL